MNGLRPSGIARAEEHGQSLIEVALMLPVLLLIVIGIVDIGRAFSYKLAVTNAAREAAIHAARNPAVTAADVCARARIELGAPAVADPCNRAPIVVTCVRGAVPCDTGLEGAPAYSFLYRTTGNGGADVTVTVRYDVSLLSGYLVGRIFAVNPVAVAATAFYPGMSQ
jgi:Flp pilus assembly protein TadG